MIEAVYTKKAAKNATMRFVLHSRSVCGTYLEHGLLILGKRVLTDELHDFSELILSLQDLSKLLTVAHELGLLVALIVVLEGSVVVGEGDVPVDGGEMLTLRKLLIQTPED